MLEILGGKKLVVGYIKLPKAESCGPNTTVPGRISDIDIGPLIGNATTLLSGSKQATRLIINSYLII